MPVDVLPCKYKKKNETVATFSAKPRFVTENEYERINLF